MHGAGTAWQDLLARAGLSGVSPRVAGAVAVVALCAAGWGIARWSAQPAEEFAFEAAGSAADAGAGAEAGTDAGATGDAGGEANAAASVETSIVVHVAGSVRRPGVVWLPAGGRVIDALDAAGGPIGDAALEAINLARLVDDGEQVYVPTTAEVEAGHVAFEPAGGAAAGGGAPGPGGVADTGGGALVNINTADASALEQLPGVGPATAAKIVADREANGPFASVEDLTRVSGIGEKRLADLRDLVTVR